MVTKDRRKWKERSTQKSKYGTAEAPGQASGRTLPMALVLLLRLGGLLAAQATSTTSHASSSSSCADALVDACPPGAVRCGVCVAEHCADT